MRSDFIIEQISSEKAELSAGMVRAEKIICWLLLPPWCVIRETSPPPPPSLSLSKSSSRGAMMSTYLTDIRYKDDQ